MKEKMLERIRELYNEYLNYSSMGGEKGRNYRLNNIYTEQELDRWALKVLVDLYTMQDGEDIDEESRLIHHDWDIIEPTIELLLENKEQVIEDDEIFAWLEKNVNKDKFLYFKLLDNNQIGAYYRLTNIHFADFYINSIKTYIREEKNKCTKD